MANEVSPIICKQVLDYAMQEATIGYEPHYDDHLVEQMFGNDDRERAGGMMNEDSRSSAADEQEEQGDCGDQQILTNGNPQLLHSFLKTGSGCFNLCDPPSIDVTLTPSKFRDMAAPILCMLCGEQRQHFEKVN